jgi:DNA invertase Pin-like site-specific DNA recombinase
MGRPPKLTDEEVQDLIYQRKSLGVTLKELAKMYSISLMTVHKILKRAGLTNPRKVENANQSS